MSDRSITAEEKARKIIDIIQNEARPTRSCAKGDSAGKCPQQQKVLLQDLSDDLMNDLRSWSITPKQHKTVAKALKILLDRSTTSLADALTDEVRRLMLAQPTAPVLCKLAFLVDELDVCRRAFLSAEGASSLRWLLASLGCLQGLNRSMLTVEQCTVLQQALRVLIALGQKAPTLFARSDTIDVCEQVLDCLVVAVFKSEKCTQDVSCSASLALVLILKAVTRGWTEFVSSLLGVYRGLRRGSSQPGARIVDVGPSDAASRGSCEEFAAMMDFSLLPDRFNFGHLALLGGLLAALKAGMLDAAGYVDVALVQLDLFSALVGAVEAKVNDYYAFYLLTLWYSWLSCVPELCTKAMFADVVSRSVKLVWSHCDSPVEGVASFAVEVLTSVIEINTYAGINRAAFARGICNSFIDLPWSIKGKHRLFTVLLRHVDVCAFLEDHPRLIVDVASCFEINYLASACGQLLSGIVQNLCAAAAPAPAKQLTDGCAASSVALVLWQRWCLQPLLDCLLSSNALVRRHSCQYWLNATLSHLPGAYRVLLDRLMDEDVAFCSTAREPQLAASSNEQLSPLSLQQQLRPRASSGAVRQRRLRILGAQLAVLVAARSLGLVQFGVGRDADDERSVRNSNRNVLLHTAVKSSCNEVRSSAMKLLCLSPKKTERLPKEHAILLRKAVAHGFAVDSAPFRQQLLHCLAAAVARLRDSIIPALRKSATMPIDADYIREAVGLLDWLFNFAVLSLFPGANYQRKITALCVIELYHQSIVPSTHGVLLSYAAREEVLDIFGLRLQNKLLRLVLDGTDEVRELAATLLLSARTTAASLSADGTLVSRSTGASEEDDLLARAKLLLHSFKTSESESGALLCRVSLGCLLRGKLRRGVRSSDDDASMPALDASEVGLHFVDLLAADLRATLEKAKANLCLASSTSSASGILSAIRQCLFHTEVLKTGSPLCWTELLSNLTLLCEELVTYVLNVLSSKSQAGESAPSFSEMGLAISSIAAEGSVRDTAADLEGSALSESQQRILSWCWHALEGCCILGGDLSELLNSNPGLVNATILQSFSNMFVQVLTRCRHKGAVEGCSIGFVRFCNSLFKSSESAIRNIPCDVLEQALGCLSNHYCSSSSVTRRSAGLPNLIACVLVSEQKAKMSHLVHTSMDRLLAVLAQPADVDVDVRTDLPQVHAANMVCRCVQESALSEAVRRHLARIAQLALDAFASPHWSLRNAALQLFAAVTVRLLGQGRTAGVKGSSTESSAASTTATTTTTALVSADELFTYYPALKDYFSCSLDLAARHLSLSSGACYSNPTAAAPADALRLQPAAFAILSLLSRLAPGATDDDDDNADKCGDCSRAVQQHAYLDAIADLLAHPSWAVRELTASAYVAALPGGPREASRAAVKLLRTLPCSAAKCASTNRVHGTLLAVDRLLQHLRRTPSVLDGKSICESLVEKSWLLTHNECNITKAAYLDVVTSAVSFPEVVQCVDSIVTAADLLVDAWLKRDFNQATSVLLVGEDAAAISAVRLCCSPVVAASTKNSSSNGPETKLASYLRCASSDSTLSALMGPLLDVCSAGRPLDIELQVVLLEVLLSSTSFEVVGICTRLLLDHLRVSGQGIDPCAFGDRFESSLAVLRQRAVAHESSVGAASLELYATVLAAGQNALTRKADRSIDEDTVSCSEVADQCQYMAELIELLAKASQPTRTEHWRQHAAASLRRLLPFVWRPNCCLDTSDQLRLLLVALALLDDENSAIREEAADAVSEALAWHPAIEGRCCCPSLLKVVLLDAVAAMHFPSIYVHNLYASFFVLCENEAAIILKESHSQLFEKGESNAYEEKPLTLCSRLQTFLNIVRRLPTLTIQSADTTWLRTEVQKVECQLSSINVKLQEFQLPGSSALTLYDMAGLLVDQLAATEAVTTAFFRALALRSYLEICEITHTTSWCSNFLHTLDISIQLTNNIFNAEDLRCCIESGVS